MLRVGVPIEFAVIGGKGRSNAAENDATFRALALNGGGLAVNGKSAGSTNAGVP